MFEYITIILQFVFIVVIAAYIVNRLSFLCLDARRNHLRVRLAEVECDILESRTQDSNEAEYSDYLLEYTKHLRGNFCATTPDGFFSSTNEFLESVKNFPDEHQKFAVNILYIQLLFLATKSMVVFIVMQIVNNMDQEKKKAQQSATNRARVSQIADTTRFFLSAFSPMQPNPV